MPQSGMAWRHVVINTKCTWLHGDARGFRSRGGRIESSGDYKHPPPKGEHEGLHTYHQAHSGPEITLEHDIRYLVGRAMTACLLDGGHRLLALAVGKTHTHLLIELVDNIRSVRAIIGDAKRLSSRAVKDELPGSIWAAGGTYERIKNRSHHENVYPYILYERGWGRGRGRFRIFLKMECTGASGPIRGGAKALPRRVGAPFLFQND